MNSNVVDMVGDLNFESGTGGAVCNRGFRNQGVYKSKYVNLVIHISLCNKFYLSNYTKNISI